MNTQISLLIVFLLLIGVSSCSANQAKSPDWITEYAKQYPHEDYLCGLGIGKTREQAHSKALSELSMYFETTVKGSIQSIEKEESATINKRTQNQISSSITSQIDVLTTGKIEFAEIKESWKDPKTGNWYLLLVMDKLKIRDYYNTKINDCEKLLEEYVMEGDQALAYFNNLQRALKLANECSSYYYIYNALASDSKDMRSPMQSENDIIAALNDAKTKVTYFVVVENDDEESIESAVKETLQKYGFTFSQTGDYKIVITAKQSDMKVMNKQFFVKTDAVVKIYFQDLLLSQIKDTTQQSDVDQASAYKRSIKSLSAQLSRKIIVTLCP